LVPGLGQVYKGQILDGVCFLFFFVVGAAFLVIPGVLIWIWGIYNAATFDPDQPSMALSGSQILISGAIFLGVALLVYATS
jgi:hypothetical protein